jgi:hypothetical protein
MMNIDPKIFNIIVETKLKSTLKNIQHGHFGFIPGMQKRLNIHKPTNTIQHISETRTIIT